MCVRPIERVSSREVILAWDRAAVISQQQAEGEGTVSTLFLAALLGFGVQEPKVQNQAANPDLDGKWMIVYAEEHGRRNNSWEQQQATFTGNTLSFEEGGKQRSLQLTFGHDQTAQATLTDMGGKPDQAAAAAGNQPAGKECTGVFIAAQDYFCVSLRSHKKGAAAAAEEEEAKPKDDKSPMKSSGSFILILRRQR
jgi:hypothetical protein